MADEKQSRDVRVRDVFDGFKQMFAEAKQTHGADDAISAVSAFTAYVVHDMEHIAQQPDRGVHPQLARAYALGLFMRGFFAYLEQHYVAGVVTKYMRGVRPQGEA